MLQGLGLANSRESEAHWLRLGLGLSRDVVHPRCLAQRGPQLRRRSAASSEPRLRLAPGLGLVVGVAGQVSEQRLAVSQGVSRQQLPDLLHCLLISHLLLLQRPD